MLTQSQLLLECRVNWRKLLPPRMETLISKNSLKKEKKIEQCSGNRSSTAQLQQGKSPPRKENQVLRTITEETLKLLDGPTASFQWRCSNK
jgi:hypothetical protein